MAVGDAWHHMIFIAMSRSWLSRITDATVGNVALRRSHWRPGLFLLAVSIGWKVFVLTVGVAVPHWLIDDGLDHIPVAMQPYATQARATALALWDRPIERSALVRLVRVVSVDSARTGELSGRCGGKSARVRAYTFFAIPYSEVRTMCDSGVVEYRVFRRRR